MWQEWPGHAWPPRSGCLAVSGPGPRTGIIGRLSDFLEHQPLRSRSGIGGFALPHHATIDVFLRLCREADNHTRLYRPAVEANDEVILDHGVYSKLAYCLAVLRERHPDAGRCASYSGPPRQG
jgi:dTMP kinase